MSVCLSLSLSVSMCVCVHYKKASFICQKCRLKTRLAKCFVGTWASKWVASVGGLLWLWVDDGLVGWLVACLAGSAYRRLFSFALLIVITVTIAVVVVVCSDCWRPQHFGCNLQSPVDCFFTLNAFLILYLRIKVLVSHLTVVQFDLFTCSSEWSALHLTLKVTKKYKN